MKLDRGKIYDAAIAGADEYLRQNLAESVWVEQQTRAAMCGVINALCDALEEAGPEPEWARMASEPGVQRIHDFKARVSETDAELRARIKAAAPAPHVKVTEVVGRFERWNSNMGLELMSRDGESGRIYGLATELAPPEAVEGGEMDPQGFVLKAPRGRFKITVEFWPEEGT